MHNGLPPRLAREHCQLFYLEVLTRLKFTLTLIHKSAAADLVLSCDARVSKDVQVIAVWTSR
eukprot:10603081-Karenia_brevis.AAC.1